MSRVRWIDWLSGWKGILFTTLVVVLTALLGWSALQVRIEQSNASMNARNDQQTANYQDFKESFGSDEILLLSVTHPDLLDTAGITLINELSSAAASLDGVVHVESLTTARQLVHGDLGAEELPIVQRPFDRPGLASELGRVLDRNAWLTGLLISPDRRTAGIAIEIEDRPDDDAYRGRIIDALRELIEKQRPNGIELHLTGITVQKHDVARLVDRDRKLILPLSALVLALALAVILRRVSGVLLPLLITAMTVAWTLGIYSLLGYPVNVITSLLPPVIMVISISTSIHLYQGWGELARRYDNRRDRAHELLRNLLAPCFLTTLTTALGLLSLTVSEIPAIQQFGLFAAIGVSISFMLNITLLPLAFIYMPLRRHGAADRIRAYAPLLNRVGALSVTHPVAILVVAGLLSLIGGAGVTRLHNNTDLLSFLKEQSPLVRDTAFIDQHLTGANALELVLRHTDGAALTTLADAQRMAHFQAELRRLDDVGSVLGLTDLIEQIHRAEHDLPRPQLPEQSDELLLCFDLLEVSEDPKLVGRLVTPDFAAAHINVRMRAVGSARARLLIESIAGLAERSLGDGYDLRITGSYYNVVMESDRLVVSQLQSLGLALGMVLLAMAAMFRSGKLLLAALVPNLLPVLWTGGIMGYLGIALSSGTVMIGSVVLGIAVDDTIHYLVRLRREHSGDLARALQATTSRTGPALIISSVVLALGFWVGALGSFWPTIHFSLLTGLTIISALACDLLVLPACLILVGPGPGKTIR
jgi:hydrophobe/amphiphile efflux-3 (HAE3) family protein